MGWSEAKKRALAMLEDHIKAGRIDDDMLDLLRAINNRTDLFTTSSCSGRIQLYETELPGTKFGLRTVKKWHRPVEVEELVLNGDNLWMAMLPPILHVSARDMRSALLFISTARRAGFKRGGINSAKNFKVNIEVQGTERMDVPLILDRRIVVPGDVLPRVVDRANRLLVRSKVRIRRLTEMLQENL